MMILDCRGAFRGARFVVLAVAINAMRMNNGRGPGAARPSSEQTLKWLHWIAGRTSTQVGVVLELFGFAVWVCFVRLLFVQARDSGWPAVAAFARRIVTVKVASGTPMLAVYLLRYETARVLSDMIGLAFVLDWLAGLFVTCASSVCTLSRVLGILLGRSGVGGVAPPRSSALPVRECTLWPP
jgi:hypothetical protein